MDDVTWQVTVRGLSLAQDQIALLGRCLDVERHLQVWRDTGSSWEGTLAADALDQALGLVDELAAGEISQLAATIRSVLEVLPPPLD